MAQPAVKHAMQTRHPPWKLGDVLMCGPDWGRVTPLYPGCVGVIALFAAFISGAFDRESPSSSWAWLAAFLGVALLSLMVLWFAGRSSARQYYRGLLRRRADGRCMECFYPVQAEWGACPECGVNQPAMADDAKAWLRRL